ncbi:MAG TPA: Rpn family recombination-promoting nuclease/putative transposase [Chitinispirillaceae bacterium]|nr:Rpn family recombination-promoting nuclease/putative transposase [Chitinispirillaceae bacterium]
MSRHHDKWYTRIFSGPRIVEELLRSMAMRMGRYIFEFYQEIQKLSNLALLNPAFPILIYNGNAKWDAPEKFSELLHQSSIPKEYLPEFKYFKIAINEISKRELVKIRNAVAAVFYIENSSAADMTSNWKELVNPAEKCYRKRWY